MSNKKHHDHHDQGHEVEEIDCLEAIDNLYAYLDGELTDKETLAKFKSHLGHCKSCYSRAEMEKALSEHIRRSEVEQSGTQSTPDSLISFLFVMFLYLQQLLGMKH